jgi:RNA recognition motif. (a.k.a. RRM, RBD, or RNP domain)
MRSTDPIPPRCQESGPAKKKVSTENNSTRSRDKNSSSVNSLYVHGLPLMLNSNGLKQFFSQFGTVSSTTRVIRNKGYGFVDFVSPEGVEAALAAASSPKPLLIDGLYLRLERVRGEAIESTSGFGGSWTTSSTSSLPGTPGVKPEMSEGFPEGGAMNVAPPLASVAADKRIVAIEEVPPETTIDDLQKIMSAFGAIRSVHFTNQVLGGAASVASTEHFVMVRFAEHDAVIRAMTGCQQEAISATVKDNLTLDIGPYHQAPNLVDVLEFMSSFGELVSADIVHQVTKAIVVFEYEASAEVALRSPVYARGTRMLLEPARDLEPSKVFNA